MYCKGRHQNSHIQTTYKSQKVLCEVTYFSPNQHNCALSHGVCGSPLTDLGHISSVTYACHPLKFVCGHRKGILTSPLKLLTEVASKCCFCLQFAHYMVSWATFKCNYNSCNVWHTLYLRWFICDGLLAMKYLRWQQEIFVASYCMSYH